MSTITIACALLLSMTVTAANALGSRQSGRLQTPRVKIHIPGVGERNVLFLDRTRTTYNYLSGTNSQGRRILCEVRYPSSTATAGEIENGSPMLGTTPYPVIVFAEGYRAKPDLYAKLLEAWVREGYVVISPEFPDTTYPKTDPAIDAGYPHGNPENDLVNEPQDIAFVLSQVSRFSSRPKSLFHNLVDLDKVILAGQSDGAALVDAYAFDTKYALDRSSIRAVAVFAGYEISSDSSFYREPAAGAIPALIIQSAADTCNAPELSVQMYDSIEGEKYFMKIIGATHLGPFDGSDALAFTAVRNMTLRFFARALSQESISKAAVLKAGRLAGIAIPSDSPSVAPIAPPPGSPYCAPAY